VKELTDTNSAQIAAALTRARKEAGSPAMGMVLTLVVAPGPAGAARPP
jgi:hypothetical protein